MKKLQADKFFTKHHNVLLLSILCTILWGSAYPCIKTGYQLFGLATNDISGKLVFAGIRFFVAGLITLTIYMLQNKRFIYPERNKLKGIFMVSITQTVLEYLFFYISMSHITGVKGSILNASSSFFVVILAHLFYKNDKITFPKMIGCIIGFGGIIMINLNGMSSFDFGFNFMGDGMMLLSGLSFAVGSLLSKNMCQKSDPMLVTGYQLGFGGFLLLIIGLLSGGTLKSVSISGILLLVYMSFLSATAFTIWTILSKYNKISKIAVFNFLTPVFGAILSSVFLGESLLTWNNILALLLVSLGIGIVNMVKNTSSIRSIKS